MSHPQNRKTWAIIWIIVAFLLVIGGQYFFYKFSMDSLNTYGISRGMTFGCVLWTTVMFGAMWRRHSWARYALISFMCVAITGFGAVALMLKSDSLVPLPTAMHAVVLGMLLYAAALVPLGATQTLRDHLGLRSGRGR